MLTSQTDCRMDEVSQGRRPSQEVVVEVLLHPNAVLKEDIRPVAERVARSMIHVFSPAKEVPCGHVKELRSAVKTMRIDDSLDRVISPDDARIAVRVARLNSDTSFVEGAEDNLFEEGGGNADETAACEVTPLPHTSLLGLWESLYFDTAPRGCVTHLPAGETPPKHCGALKSHLLSYARAGLLLADFNIDTSLVSWNRVILFHGPPGTGKTSLCRALAQKLSISLSDRYEESALVDINTHSLFSKWFSESGKLVMKLFRKVREMADDPSRLVILLIDEVESLAAARKAALSSSEPSDAIRVVNALLTQLDAMRRYPNVLTLCTSNITEAIDLAFVDRADCKIFIGNPGFQARQHLLMQSVNELVDKRLIAGSHLTEEDTASLLGPLLKQLDGCSGRFLRKLPFLAFVAMSPPRPGVDLNGYAQALCRAAERELADRQTLEHP